MSTNAEKVTELRERGNECVRVNKHAEAVLHYSQAIQLEPTSPQLHSNRSLAFLKLQHFYHALEDAETAIRLDPAWAKGYFRKAEVEFATKHYEASLESYRRASQLQQDAKLLEYVLRANREMLRQKKVEQQTPWVAAGIGLILGVLLVVGDAVIAEQSVLTHPLLQAIITIVFSLLGLVLGCCYRWYVQNQRKALLEPPIDLLGEGERSSTGEGDEDKGSEEQPQEETKHHSNKYSKAQARYRYKKGKS